MNELIQKNENLPVESQVSENGLLQAQIDSLNENQDKYLTFNVSDDVFGINILRIKEIIEYDHVCMVPMVPNYIRGVINLRGNVVPVIDLAHRMEMEPCDVNRRSCIVIIEVKSEDEIMDIGILVDAVKKVYSIPETEIEDTPSFGAKIRVDFIQGMGKVNGDFVVLLELDKVLDIDELSIINNIDIT